MGETITYFAYGSNLDPVGMQLRAPASYRRGKARLLDWRLTFRGVADIEPAEGDEVLGGLWELTEEDAESIDGYEGAPHFYERVDVLVEAPGIGTVKAMTYVMTEKYGYELGLPSQGYFNTIVQGFRVFGWPLERLEEVLKRVRDDHEQRGIDRYYRRGPKRMMAVIPEPEPEWDPWDSSGMSPATRRLYALEEGAAA